MIKERSFQLLFLSASLLWSPAIFSVNDTAAHAASIAATGTAPIQVAMLVEKGTGSSLEKTLPTNKTPSTASSERPAAEPTAEVAPRFSDEEIAEQRKIFLQAEEALKKKDNAKYFLLSDKISEYPLYPYLQYKWLKKNLGRERQIKHFLQAHESSRYARPLKRKWLYHLAKNNQWQTFLDFYTTTSDANLNCYKHRAEFKTGDKVSALNGAAKMWAVGKSQPKTCDPLFAQLKKSKLFNQELFWQRFDDALQNNKTSLAKYVRKLMSPADQKTADLC